MSEKRVLIITPKFPYPSTGACESDRAAGIEWFKNHGYEVHVITKVYNEEIAVQSKKTGQELGVTVWPFVYFDNTKRTVLARIWHRFKQFLQPWYWDGAAYEYTDPELKNILDKELKTFKPQLVWCEYTYLWPLFSVIKKYNLPIITRSHNFEPNHYLEEDGLGLKTPLVYLAKLHSEWRTARKSTVLAAITPSETKKYQFLASAKTKVFTLPLRGLTKFTQIQLTENQPLAVYFMGSTYNVTHNYAAASFLVNQVVPAVRSKLPGVFSFFILGGKVPKDLLDKASSDLCFPGYIPASQFDSFLKTMNICLAPSLYGAGMQQKVFEPLMRGFPTITSARALVGYKFQDGQEVLLAESVPEFVNRLSELQDTQKRDLIGKQAAVKAESLFNQTEIDKIINNIIQYVTLNR